MRSTRALLISVFAGIALGIAILFAAGWWFITVCTFHLVNQSSHTLTDVRFSTPPDEKSPQGFVRDIGVLQPGETRWVFLVPRVYGSAEFSFSAAGRTHRADVSGSTYAMGTVWTITVDTQFRAKPDVKFNIL
jgi:hypothetical protein